MARHHPCPAFDNGRSLYSGGTIDRIVAAPAVREGALDAINLGATLIGSSPGGPRDLLAEMADRRKNSSHQMLARRARKNGAVRAYHRHQDVLGVYNRSIIRDEIGQFCRYKDESSPTFLG